LDLYDLTRAWVAKLAERASPSKGVLPHSFDAERRAALLYAQRFREPAPLFLRIAALLHDVERVFPAGEVRREDFADYDTYKREHATRSAEIARAFLLRQGADEALVDAVSQTISRHEHGGDRYSDTILDADSTSFFEDNFASYLAENGPERTRDKVRFMYLRMSPEARETVRGMDFEGALQSVFDEAAAGEE
jgi:hypothetical protein